MFLVTVLINVANRNFDNSNLIFKKRLKFNILANGKKNSKLYSSYSYYSFTTMQTFGNIPCDRPHNSYLLGFWSFKLKKKFEIFINIGPWEW